LGVSITNEGFAFSVLIYHLHTEWGVLETTELYIGQWIETDSTWMHCRLRAVDAWATSYEARRTETTWQRLTTRWYDCGDMFSNRL